jgi:hypothetical protein
MKIKKCLFFNTTTALLPQDFIVIESLGHYFKTYFIMHWSMAVLYVKF